jgi:endonuclease/exonuclease/phosphatase (EEP) superfamily protein YafD
MVLWLLLRLVFFDTIWWLALLNTGALYLFLPLPILLGLALIRRCWRVLPALALPAAGFAWLFGALFLPAWPPAQLPVTPSLSVITFNLLYRNRDYAAIGATIAGARPDIIGIQELSRRQMTALRELLRPDYPYAQFHKPGNEAGVGLFSRYPITAATGFPLPPRNLALHAIVPTPAPPSMCSWYISPRMPLVAPRCMTL